MYGWYTEKVCLKWCIFFLGKKKVRGEGWGDK